MIKINCIVIDDERLAREYIKEYISKVPQLELIGEFNSPLKALELIKSGSVDLIFLDIQMPDITGIDFLKSISHPPEVIFTTAYQEFAIEGFNLNAADYLLKPFAFDRFFQAVNKVIDKLEQIRKTEGAADASSKIHNMMEDEYLTIRADRKLYKINHNSIRYIEGQKAYVTFHTDKKRITALASMKDLEDSLPAKKFIRIHKSFIVAIKEIIALDGNLVDLESIKLPIGKTYRNAVHDIFGVKKH